MPREPLTEFRIDGVRVLAPDGSVDADLEPDLDDERLVDMYRTMKRSRRLDERAIALQRRGELGTYAPAIGQEAAQIGSAHALAETDWMVTSFREGPAYLARGTPPRALLWYAMGMEEGAAVSRSSRNMPPSIPVGSQTLHAAGLGWGQALAGEDAATLCFLGDGATSEGDAYEALNLAGVFDAHAVFLCQNNQYAISVPRSKQTRAETLAQKAIAAGIEGVVVDGNDVLGTYTVVRDALESARGGDPVLVEAETYRRSMHTTADDPSVYRKDDEEAEWEARDPIARFETYLRERGVLDDDRIAEIEEAIEAELREEIDAANEGRQGVDPVEMFDYTFETPTPEIERQRARFEETASGDRTAADGEGAVDRREATTDREATGGERLRLVEAVRVTLFEEMARDDSVVVYGQDVGVNGGVFRATQGLIDEYPDRVFDAPVAEAGIVGTGVGLAAYGFRPVPEIEFSGFMHQAFHQLQQHVSRLRSRTRGEFGCPMTIRAPYGGGIRALEHHSESFEAGYAHTPGLKVVVPSTPADAKGLLTASIRDPDPVVFFEPSRLYRSVREEVPAGEHVVPLGEADVVRAGDDVTVVAWGAMRRLAVEVADSMPASVEVIDPRSIVPFDTETVLDSVRKTGRCVVVHEAPRTAGMAAEVTARINDRALYYLEAPVERVTGYDVPYPLFAREDEYVPDEGRIRAGIERALSA